MKCTISSAPLPRGTPSSFNRNWPVEGSTSKLRTLQRAVVPLRQEERAEALATVRFETPPGQQIQIDFGEKVVRIAGQPVKVYLMTAVLGYSRRLYCRAFLAQRQDDWLEGLDGAFRHFGGLTEQILCDNASPLVISHDRQSGQVVWNPGFEAFCRDRGLTRQGLPSPPGADQGKDRTRCRLRQAQCPGRAIVRFVRGVGTSPGHMDGRGCRSADPRHDQGTACGSLRARRASRPCGLCRHAPWPFALAGLKRRVSADCFVDIDTIRYSVPYRHVRETVEVVVKEEEVEIWLRGTCIAKHARCLEPHTLVRNPAHFEGLFRREAGTPASALLRRRLPTPCAARCRSMPRWWKEVARGHADRPYSTRKRSGFSRR